MNQILSKTRPFKKTETYKHKCAIEVLQSWVGGYIEQPFYSEGKIVFVPDLAVYVNGILSAIYEVYVTHPLDGRKYGMIQYWCYLNCKELTVFEVSAEYIMEQKEKPENIRVAECYIVDPFEYDEIQDYLINPIN